MDTVDRSSIIIDCCFLAVFHQSVRTNVGSRALRISAASHCTCCNSQTIAFSEASHDRPADVVICESRCMDSLQSNVIRLTGCGEGMYNLINLFPTSFNP